MKKNTKLQTAAVISYVTAAILFTLFLIYMSVFEHNSVYQARKSRTYDIVEDCYNLPENLERYFDYEAFARDLEIEGYTETNYGTILV